MQILLGSSVGIRVERYTKKRSPPSYNVESGHQAGLYRLNHLRLATASDTMANVTWRFLGALGSRVRYG